MPAPLTPTWLEVDLSAVAHNTRAVLARTRQPLMAVVKANAYGLGAVAVGQSALQAGAAWLAVARAGEALELRRAGITAPVLVFGMATPDEIDQAIASGITLSLHSFESAKQLAQRAAVAGKPVQAHLKVDTGFGRLGVLPDQAVALAERARDLGGIEIDGVYSHLAMADEVPDHPLTRSQIRHFSAVLAGLKAAGHAPRWAHLTNSAAAFGLPEAHFNLVRAGSALIGLKPHYYLPFPSELKRVVAWKALLAACKQLPDGWAVGYGQTYQPAPGEWIGTLPLGYGDGFRRMPENQVLIDGQRCPVVGRVCNDMCMVRLPQAFPEGTEVAVIGSQGNEAITTDELVDRWQTSQADILSSINPRVVRRYISRT